MNVTREQALLMLRSFSAMEGFLMASKDSGYKEVLDVHALPIIDMLLEILGRGHD